MKKYFILVFVTLFCISLTESLNAASRYPDIDQEIMSMQKGLISDIEKILRIDAQKGMMQSGSLDHKMKIDTKEGSGSVNVNIRNYKTTYDAKTKNTEATFLGSIGLDITGSNTDYESYNEETGLYKKIPFQFIATIQFDASMIVTAEGAVFMKISRLDATSQGDMRMKGMLDLAIFSLEQYIGKTYKLPESTIQTNDFDPESIQKDMLLALDVLKTKPLFTIISKRDNTYNLRFNRSTMKSLGWNMSLKGSDILSYLDTEKGGKLTFSERKNPKNNITLTETDGKRRLDLAVTDTQAKNGKEQMSGSFSQEGLYMSYKDKSSSFLLDWKNGKLDILVSNKKRNRSDSTTPFTLTIKGDLLMDGSKMDLILSWNGKNIGSMTGKKVGKVGEYAMNMALPMPLGSFMMDLRGAYIDEIGDFQIFPPTLYELLD